MTRAQMLDIRDEIVEMAENLNTVINGTDVDDIPIVKPLIKISQQLSAFAGKLDEMSQQ